jgi:hypothetical protein
MNDITELREKPHILNNIPEEQGLLRFMQASLERETLV